MQAVAIARLAGEALEFYREKDLSVKTKSNNTPVTIADLEANAIVCKGLQDIQGSDIPILSEENAEQPSWEERQMWSQYWLIDPLDGTKEYIRGSNDFTVNIALISGHQPVLGVVFSPAKDLLYFASAAQGAFMEHNSSQSKITVRKANNDRLVAVGSRSWMDERTATFLKKLPQHQYIGMGSSLKPCLIAEGKADIYARFGPTCEWDTAAAHCVLAEAGGDIVDVAGQPLRYNQSESVINPSFVAVGDTTWQWQQYLID